MIPYLLDEHVSPAYARQIRRRDPFQLVWNVGDPDAPLKGTSDPEILTEPASMSFRRTLGSRSINKAAVVSIEQIHAQKRAAPRVS